MSMQQIVQASSKETIPMEFVRDQPAITTFHCPVPEIPTINLSELDLDKVVKAVEEASMEWGIFQVVNHGIPVELIQRLQSVGRELFELPLEKYAKPDGVDGYGIKLQKGKKNGWVNHLFHNIWPPSRINYQYWPQNPPSYREVNEEYAKYIRQVADKLIGILSLGLGLPENAIKEAIGGEELLYLLKINYYPPCPRPDLALGVAAHTDFSALTILVSNEVTGLQVLKDDRWVDAKYVLNALIINIGDQIEILSNGKYKSVLHRSTVEKKRTRMSWPVFLDPPVDLVVGPFAQLINDENPPKYKAKKFNDYIYCKFNKIPQ